MAEYFYKKFLFHIATLCVATVNSCLCVCVCVAAAGRLTVVSS